MRDSRDTEAMEAAFNAVDPDRLLPGEDPNSWRSDDVRHWIAVYSELLATKTEILEKNRANLEAATSDAVRDELGGDQTLLTAEVNRFRRRMRFWLERQNAVLGWDAS